MRAADLTGTKYGALTVQAQATSDALGKAQWSCLCDCGETRVVLAQHLKAGRTRSCGTCGLGGQYGVQARAAIPMSYRVMVYDGPDMFKDRPYSFGIVLDANGTRIAKTSEPIARVTSRGEGHAAASRCMRILVAMEKINPQNNRTWRRWLTEERVVVEIAGTASTTSEVDAKWEEITGQGLPKSSGLAAIQQPRTVTYTPAEIAQQQENSAAMLALLKDAEEDND